MRRFASFVLLDLFTVPVPGKEHVVIGYAVQPEIRALFPPTDPPERLLQSAGWDASRIYTKGSLVCMETVLPVIWLAAFGSLSVLLGTFAMTQRRDGPREADSKPEKKSDEEGTNENSKEVDKPEHTEEGSGESESF